MPLRLLTFSTLYPNNARPNHGVFVENRLRHLVAGGEASSEVVAPVPWFPLDHPRFGDWAVMDHRARISDRHDIVFPVAGEFLDARYHLLRGHLTPRLDFALYLLAAGKDLDVGATNIDHEDIHAAPIPDRI